MRIDIITVLPEMIEGFFNCSIMKRAQDKGLAEIHIHNLRDKVGKARIRTVRGFGYMLVANEEN
mgnify:CR=1 FL=1